MKNTPFFLVLARQPRKVYPLDLYKLQEFFDFDPSVFYDLHLASWQLPSSCRAIAFSLLQAQRDRAKTSESYFSEQENGSFFREILGFHLPPAVREPKRFQTALDRISAPKKTNSLATIRGSKISRSTNGMTHLVARISIPKESPKKTGL